MTDPVEVEQRAGGKFFGTEVTLEGAGAVPKDLGSFGTCMNVTGMFIQLLFVVEFFATLKTIRVSSSVVGQNMVDPFKLELEFCVALVTFVGFFQVQFAQNFMDFLVQFGIGQVVFRRIGALAWI